MSDRNTVTSGDRTRIAYDTFGDGPGIVLVPGALHCGHHYRALADCLADEFTVYCVDRRGRPGSGPQRPDHNIEPECQDLIAVLEKTGASLVFGHSSGGVVALQTALRRPLAKLAVYEPPVSIHGSVPTGFLPDLDRAVARGRKPDALAVLSKALHADRRLDKMPTFALKLLMRLASRRAAPQLRELIEAIGTFPAEHRMITALDSVADAYRHLDTEMLILLGDQSPDYLARGATFLAETAPRAQLVVLPGLDHSGPEDRAPDRVAAELRTFFAESSTPAAKPGQIHRRRWNERPATLPATHLLDHPLRQPAERAPALARLAGKAGTRPRSEQPVRRWLPSGGFGRGARGLLVSEKAAGVPSLGLRRS